MDTKKLIKLGEDSFESLHKRKDIADRRSFLIGFGEGFAQSNSLIQKTTEEIREKRLKEVKRIMNYIIDNSIKTEFKNGQRGYLSAMIEQQNLMNLAQITDTEEGWELYERLKKINYEGY